MKLKKYKIHTIREDVKKLKYVKAKIALKCRVILLET